MTDQTTRDALKCALCNAEADGSGIFDDPPLCAECEKAELYAQVKEGFWVQTTAAHEAAEKAATEMRDECAQTCWALTGDVKATAYIRAIPLTPPARGSKEEMMDCYQFGKINPPAQG